MFRLFQTNFAMAFDDFKTRQSLLLRLRNWDDQGAWRDFFDRYWKLIYSTALKAGLDDSEAQDVVQDTMISIARQIEQFRYDPKRGQFRGWLLQITRWRIADQFARRQPGASGDGTPGLEQVVDASRLDQHWESEWRKSLIDAALMKIRPSVPARDFDVFNAVVMQSRSVEEASLEWGLTAQQVYNIRHKVTKLLAVEIKAMEKLEF